MVNSQKVKTKLSHAQWTEPPSKDRPQRFFGRLRPHWRDQARELPLFLDKTQSRNYVNVKRTGNQLDSPRHRCRLERCKRMRLIKC